MVATAKNLRKHYLEAILFGFMVLMASIIFIGDIWFRPNADISALYCIVILFSWLLSPSRIGIYTGIGCVSLTVIGFVVLFESNISNQTKVLNFIITLMVLITCTALVTMAKSTFLKKEDMLEVLEKKVNERTQMLEESQQELKESERLYRYLYENAAEMYVSVDPSNGTIVRCNETLCEKLGRTKEELLGSHVFSVYHPDSLTDAERAFAEFRKNGSVQNVELSLKTKKGKTIDVILNASSVKDDEGTILYSRSSWTDVTQLKKIQRTLQQRSELLELQNRELEQFVYIASHDLQEPLRTVNSFAEVLSSKYVDGMDELGKKSVRFIQEATMRMSTLVAGLLHYGRIGRSRNMETLDCRILVQNAIKDLNTIIEDSRAKITIGELPKKIRVYSTEFRQLVQNLIANAIKFRKEDEVPKIYLKAQRQKKNWMFSIEDNGIGIAPEHQERVFKIFQRLHNREKYEGTGIGLANCKKIIDLHGGDIWVESALGMGSTFYFTIPK